MSNLAPEVKLVTMKFKTIRTDRPYVEYSEYKNGDIIPVDRFNERTPTISYETYKAEVLKFRKVIPSNVPMHYGGTPHVEDTYIALDRDSRKVVDMFLHQEREKYLESMESMRLHINNLKKDLIEAKLTLWQRFKRFIDGKKFTWSWDL